MLEFIIFCAVVWFLYHHFTKKSQATSVEVLSNKAEKIGKEVKTKIDVWVEREKKVDEFRKTL